VYTHTHKHAGSNMYHEQVMLCIKCQVQIIHGASRQGPINECSKLKRVICPTTNLLVLM
jgi:hypothetical protein